YARRGWPVLPIFEPADGRCTCPKGRACESSGKHPRSMHGIKDASCNEAVIREWFKAWPRMNLALVGGDRLAILDVDPRSGGRDELFSLFSRHDYIPGGPSVETGGGGQHLYFDPGRAVRSRAVAPAVELKCIGCPPEPSHLGRPLRLGEAARSGAPAAAGLLASDEWCCGRAHRRSASPKSRATPRCSGWRAACARADSPKAPS